MFSFKAIAALILSVASVGLGAVEKGLQPAQVAEMIAMADRYRLGAESSKVTILRFLSRAIAWISISVSYDEKRHGRCKRKLKSLS